MLLFSLQLVVIVLGDDVGVLQLCVGYRRNGCFFLLLGPFTVPVDEEVEAQHMKFIQAPPRKCFNV